MKDIQRSLRAYFIDWDAWCEGSIVFDFASLKPIQAGWKVPDEKSLGDKVTELLPLTLQAYISTVNDRKIALLATRDLVENIPVIQLMQMRPKSKDKARTRPFIYGKQIFRSTQPRRKFQKGGQISHETFVEMLMVY